MTEGLIFALVALGLATTGWAGYLATVPKGRVARKPVIALGLQVLAVFGAGAGVELGVQRDEISVVAIIAATLAFVLAALFFFLFSVRKTPLGKLAVSVGQPSPSFAALTPEGDRFESSSFAERWVLLKFFRGSW